MRRLMLLRHAKTERAEPGEPDRERKLTKRGRHDVPVIATYMARHKLIPELAIVSPARRAQETWVLLASAFAKAPRVIDDERIYNASADAIIAVIAASGTARSLLVVGHNPGLHDAAVRLIGTGDVDLRGHVTEKLPTCGLIVIDLPFDEWSRLHHHAGRLERFVTPRLIAAATD